MEIAYISMFLEFVAAIAPPTLIQMAFVMMKMTAWVYMMSAAYATVPEAFTNVVVQVFLTGTATVMAASSTSAASATALEAFTSVGVLTFPKGTVTATEANLTR